MKSIAEQLKALNEIMGKPQDQEEKSYCLKGKTFMLKEDLKSWGWNWNPAEKHWELIDVYPDDPSLRIVKGIESTWVEEL